MKPRRILLMSYHLGIGGSERQLAEIARALDPERFEVHVGCQIPGGIRTGELTAAKIPIVSFPMNSYASFGAFRQAARLGAYIRRHLIDLVHAFDVPMDIFAIPVAKLSRGPAVLGSQRAHRSLTSGLRLRVLRATDRLADGIVVNCEFIRRHLIEDEGVSAGKLHLCYNGIDERSFEFRSPAVRERSSPVIAGCVCALRPEKNLPVLVRAFAHAQREKPDSRLIIVGSGPEREPLERLVADLGIAPAVNLVAEARDVRPWLNEIDIFVLPSRTEALSNSLIEAMACGCSAVASDVGGNPELIGRDERGMLFPSGDADALSAVLLTLMRDPEMRARKAVAARAFLEENLTIRASVRRMTEIYDSFLGTAF